MQKLHPTYFIILFSRNITHMEDHLVCTCEGRNYLYTLKYDSRITLYDEDAIRCKNEDGVKMDYLDYYTTNCCMFVLFEEFFTRQGLIIFNSDKPSIPFGYVYFLWVEAGLSIHTKTYPCNIQILDFFRSCKT